MTIVIGPNESAHLKFSRNLPNVLVQIENKMGLPKKKSVSSYPRTRTSNNNPTRVINDSGFHVVLL
jgi:hypothetical protein